MRGQGAGVVQKRGQAVRTVEIGGGFRLRREGRRRLLIEMGLGWEHLLVQDANYADSTRVDSIKHNMLPDFKAMQASVD